MGNPHHTNLWKHPTKGISAQCRRLNPICQFLDKESGQQCTHASTVVHHLADWKDEPDLFFSWNNLVALCADHHAGGQRGETQQNSYVDTVGVCDAIYEHGNGLPHWHPKFIAVDAGGLPPGCGTTAVGNAALDAALAQP